jgi:glycosyltransferase involved in cell wall biosynthesis
MEFLSVEHEILYRKLLKYAPIGDQTEDLISKLNERCNLLTEFSIPWGKGPAKKLAAFFKKATRFFLRWYINPIAAQQTSVNTSLLELIRHQQQEIDSMQEYMMQKGLDSAGLTDREMAVIQAHIDRNQINSVEKRPKIAYFTPLSPIRSGIALYSEDLLVELKEYFDIDIFIDTGYKPDNPDITGNFNIYVYTGFPAHAKDYDLLLFQMGNNTYHWYMVDILQNYGGIVVLHDVNLTGLALFETRNDTGKLLELARFERDREYFDHACRYIQGSPYEEYNYPLNGYVIEPSSGVIVHSHYARREVLMKDFGKAAATIPLYANKSIFRENSGELRARYGLTEEDIIIASFGHIAPPKRPAETLAAFARLVEENPDSSLKLIFVGELHDEKIRELVHSLKISERVSIVGYTSDAAFFDYMAICDICVNLRYPYKGENSATLSQILSFGKPAIVSDIGSFSEFPNDACIKVSANTVTETDEIFAAMNRLVNDRSLRERYGTAAKKYASEQLDIKKIAREYSEFIMRVLGGEKPIVTEEAIESIAHELLNEKSNALIKAKAFLISKILL